MAARSRGTLWSAVNAAVLGAIWAALIARPGPWSAGYSAMVGIGTVALGLAVLSLFGRDPIAHVAGRPAWARPTARSLVATVPWIAVTGLVAVRAAWWTQQHWALRLWVAYALLAWSAVWVRGAAAPAAASGSAQDGSPGERPMRGFLTGLAVVAALIAFDGLAFGTARFGVQVSAAIGLAAVTLALAARFARGSTCERLVTASTGVLLGLATVEVGIRALRMGESLQEVDSPEYVRQFHHITPPGTTFVNQPKPLDEFPPALVEINSKGIRGPELAPGPVDLLLIGDSMIEARQLPWEQSLSAKLPSALAARASSARVVGHGVRGWSPLLEWNWYLKAGRQLKPRNVLLFFFWNDLWTIGDEVRTFRAVLGPDGRPDFFDVAVDPAWVWYKHVRTVRMAGDILQRLEFSAVKRTLSMVGAPGAGVDLASAEDTARRMAADTQLSPADVDALLSRPADQLDPRLRHVATTEFWPGIRPLSLWTATQLEAAAKTENELRRFAEDVAADGGRLVIVYVPNAYQISAGECRVARRLAGFQDDRLLPEQSGIQAWIRGVADRHHIELIDPSDPMRTFLRAQPAGAPPLFLRADCHWSERGHQFMADFLADWYVRTREGRR